jgi:hypothetical protein
MSSGRKLVNVSIEGRPKGRPEGHPIIWSRAMRIASFETDKEAPMILGHVGHHRGDDRFPRGFKVRESGIGEKSTWPGSALMSRGAGVVVQRDASAARRSSRLKRPTASFNKAGLS